jgi:hypothetical protein
MSRAAGPASNPNNARGVLPRSGMPAPPSPELQELRRVYDAVRELDVERLSPEERRAARKLVEGMRSLTAWYAKRLLERIHWEGPE